MEAQVHSCTCCFHKEYVISVHLSVVLGVCQIFTALDLNLVLFPMSNGIASSICLHLSKKLRMISA